MKKKNNWPKKEFLERFLNMGCIGSNLFEKRLFMEEKWNPTMQKWLAQPQEEMRKNGLENIKTRVVHELKVSI